MSFYDILLARKLANHGDVTVEGLSVTENGTYSETGKAFSPVVVNVPLPSNAYLLKSASGSEISLTDAAELNLQSCVVNIEPAQSGSGTPSLSNKRPITGFSSITLTIKDNADTPTETNTFTLQLGTTVYSGELNYETGKAVIDKVLVDNSWFVVGGHNDANTGTTAYFVKASHGLANENAALTSCLEEKVVTRWEDLTPGSILKDSNPQYCVICTDVANQTQQELEAWLSTNEVQIICPLENTVELDLSAMIIPLLDGNNIITTNSGTVDIDYFAKGGAS